MSPNPVTILIVDDELQNRKLLDVLLRPEGYLTVAAATGKEALAMVAERAPDLILLDIMMPDMDGYEVASILKADPLTARIPIIMVTARFERSARLTALHSGAEDFLTKPVDRAELWLRVRNLLRLKTLGDVLENLNWVLKQQVQSRTAELRESDARFTERKEAALALFAEKERLRVTLNSIGDAVISTDANGDINYLNPVAETLTGWRNDEAFGLPLMRVFVVVDENNRIISPSVTDSLLNDQVPPALTEDALLQQRGGAVFAIEDSAAAIRGAQGQVIGIVLVFRDVSQARQMTAQMTHLASHDALTGLINRREFERRVENCMRNPTLRNKSHTLLYLDLDRFKIVNDTCGHAAGDELLRQLSAALQLLLRHSDTLARLGGDEFGVLLENCQSDSALPIAELLRQAVCDFRFVWLDKAFPIGVSLGLVTFSNDNLSLSDVLRMADAACYVAKDKGRNRIQLYAQDDRELAHRHGEMGWVARIRLALEEQRFVLHAQKIARLDPAAPDCVHHEVLLRMIDEHGELVLPMDFIPAAERYGLMPLLDRWVIKTAFARYASRRRDGVCDEICAINLSGTSIVDEHFPAYVREQFALYQIPPGGICFEITETAAITRLPHAASLIRDLKEIGCRFSLDDFGSGMSSFAYLKHLPVDYLKIDGGFVKEMLIDPIDHAMVESINHIGHVMHIQTIAEFAENDQILTALRRIGVDFAQGYGIGKPTPY